MKPFSEKFNQKIWWLPLLLFFLFSCSSALKKNQYLGRIPAIEKKYHGIITELIEGVERKGDIAHSLSLLNEFDRIEYEWHNAINQEVRINRFEKGIPVEVPEGLPLEVQEAFVDHVSRGNLVLRFPVSIVTSIAESRGLMLVFEAVDKNGKSLPNTFSVANNNQEVELTPGTQWVLFGYYQTEAIIELENLSKLKILGLEGQ